jgi:NADH:ubiquinone oxidoreductase subunit 6 (subunit J)
MLSTVLAADSRLDWFIGLLRGLAREWHLWLPLVAGGLAVYWLLPRPRSVPALWGIAAGAVALLLGGYFLLSLDGAWQETVLFCVFSAIALVAGGLLVTQRNPARAALSFALVVLATCGLFLLLAAPFLMAATVIVYAGAIVVTFLFVLMLAQQRGQDNADARSREPLLATLTGFVLLGALLYVIKVGDTSQDKERTEALATKSRLAEVDQALAIVRNPEGDQDPVQETRNTLEKLGFNDLRDQADSGMPKEEHGKLERLLLAARERIPHTLTTPPPNLPMSNASGPAPNTPRAEIRRSHEPNPQTGVPELPAQNSAYLGRSLFTDFLVPVELSGFLLLVATIGAIAIGQRRQQDISVSGPSIRDDGATGPESPGRTV